MLIYCGFIIDRNGVELVVSVFVWVIYVDFKVIYENNGFEEECCWKVLVDVLC